VVSLALENRDGYGKRLFPCVHAFFVGIHELIVLFERDVRYCINRCVPKNPLLFGSKVPMI
jgi:hypothetical protein